MDPMAPREDDAYQMYEGAFSGAIMVDNKIFCWY